MNDEIKEILELFSITDENIMFGDKVELNAKQSHLLLNYITNLQEENKRLNNLINELEKWLKEDKKYAMNTFECGRCFNIFDILDKLKELKENK